MSLCACKTWTLMCAKYRRGFGSLYSLEGRFFPLQGRFVSTLESSEPRGVYGLNLVTQRWKHASTTPHWSYLEKREWFLCPYLSWMFTSVPASSLSSLFLFLPFPGTNKDGWKRAGSGLGCWFSFFFFFLPGNSWKSLYARRKRPGAASRLLRESY